MGFRTAKGEEEEDQAQYKSNSEDHLMVEYIRKKEADEICVKKEKSKLYASGVWCCCELRHEPIIFDFFFLFASLLRSHISRTKTIREAL